MIRTQRLRLIPATVESLTAELDGRAALARHLGLRVPAAWPPDLYDRAATEYTRTRLLEDPSVQAWWMHYIVLGPEDDAVVVGAAGYKGPPDATGTVEVGYGVLKAFRRQGIATQATLGLVANAFAHPEVTRVIAETLPALTPSIGVLEKCGFSLVGVGSEEGVIRYALTRETYERTRQPG